MPDVKIFLDADPEERVRRRLGESRAKGEETSEARWRRR
jgi:cytidylate kinase